MLTLIISGEMIFSLPFHTTRFFRPTFLEVFGFTNTQLGDVFAAYGVTAMLAYFPGGLLADRYPPRLLLTISLFATAAGGLYMATIPSVTGLAFLYGYWGISTILLFWAAMITATRHWGGNRSQGRAFGILDGGRGLAAAAFALLAITILSYYLPTIVETADAAQRRQGFRMVILFYSAITAAVGVLAWLALPKTMGTSSVIKRQSLHGMLTVLRQPIVWAQAAVIVCAYSAYKGLDNYALYVNQVLGLDEVAAAKFTAYAAYLRPLGAVAAGLLADRLSASKVIGLIFFVLAIAYGTLATTTASAGWLALIYANLLLSFFAVFALRGVYFALLQEAGTPKHLTGSTVGLVSLLGFTPDIFFAPIAGRLLDAAPGVVGHQHYFMFLGGIMIVGMLIVFWLIRMIKKQQAWG